jgi:WD40 repeat protein
MSSAPPPAVLVARYLKANHYNETLDIFLKETNLEETVATTNAGDWTLEKLLEEKIQFDTSLTFEKRDLNTDVGWTRPAPSVPREPDLAVNTNVLCIRGGRDLLAVSTANNTCSFIRPTKPYAPTGHAFKADGPILSTVQFMEHYIACATMSGKLIIYDLNSKEIVGERRDHSKWTVQVACWNDHPSSDNIYLATAGWDMKINLYTLSRTSYESAKPELDHAAHSVTLPSNPESIMFIQSPDTGTLYLVASRRDSSFLYYFRVVAANDMTTLEPAGRQNLAPHSNAWVAFTPSAFALSPVDPTLVAVATSHLPHLKVIVVRLLFPDAAPPAGSEAPQTAAAVARADLALQDKEDAAISLQVSTMAPQTPYSTPQIAWRPDGSGVWVNGDDGVVRGVELKTGKVVALLRAHEVGSKVRTLWAGYVNHDDGQKQEIVASGGFDRKAFIWEIDENEQ